MKKFNGFTLGLLVLASAGLQAQSIQQEAPSISSFSGQIEVGAQSVIKGDFKKTPGNNQIGFYTNPTLGLDLNFDPAKVSLGYGLFAFGGAGYGSVSKDAGVTTPADTAYFEHNPNVKLSGKINDRFSIAFLADYYWRTHTGDQSENYTELVLEPSLSYTLGSNNTLSVAYYFYRTDSNDSEQLRSDNSDKLKASLNLNKNESIEDRVATAIQSAIEDSADSSTTIHQGKVALSTKINERLSTSTYIRAGKAIVSQRVTNDPAKDDMGTYRIQTSFNFQATSALALSGFYRFNIDNAENFGFQKFYNRVLAGATYDLGNSWALEVENDFRVNGNSNTQFFDNYSNDTYAGVKYTF